MVLPGLSEERRRVPSPTSPKRTKMRRPGFPVPRHHLQRHTNKATGEGRRSPATKFDDSTVGSSSQRIDGDCGTEAKGKKLVLDLNDVVKEEEEARESPFDDGGSEKINKCSSLKKKLVLDLNEFAKEEEEARESPFDDGGSEKNNKCSLLKKKLVLDLNDVVEEEEEEERESPFDDGGREKKNSCSLLKRADGAVNLPKLRSDSRKAPRAKLCVQLSREEIEEDVMKMTGHRLPRKPNKRPSVVQRQLDTLFPGLLLTEVTPDLYKVPEIWPVQQYRKRNNRNRKRKDV